MRLPTYQSTLPPPKNVAVFAVLQLSVQYLSPGDLVRLAATSRSCGRIAQRALWKDPVQTIAAVGNTCKWQGFSSLCMLSRRTVLVLASVG